MPDKTHLRSLHNSLNKLARDILLFGTKMDTQPTTAHKRCEFYIRKLEEIEPSVTAVIGSSAQIKTYI